MVYGLIRLSAVPIMAAGGIPEKTGHQAVLFGFPAGVSKAAAEVLAAAVLLVNGNGLC